VCVASLSDFVLSRIHIIRPESFPALSATLTLLQPLLVPSPATTLPPPHNMVMIDTLTFQYYPTIYLETNTKEPGALSSLNEVMLMLPRILSPSTLLIGAKTNLNKEDRSVGISPLWKKLVTQTLTLKKAEPASTTKAEGWQVVATSGAGGPQERLVKLKLQDGVIAFQKL